MPSEISVKLYCIHNEFQRVQKEWLWLCESGKPSFFLTWEWVENWIKTLPDNIPVFLMVLTGENIPKTAFFVGAPSTNIAHFFFEKTVSEHNRNTCL